MVESPNLMKTSGDASISASRRHYRRSHANGGPRGSGLVGRDHGWGLSVRRHSSWDVPGQSLRQSTEWPYVRGHRLAAFETGIHKSVLPYAVILH